MISKRTLIVGYSASGIDIARQVVRTCQLPLYVSQGTKSAYYAPLEDTLELPEVVELDCDDRSAVFSNGCRIQTIESIICCTGFVHDLTYLDQSTVPMNNPPRLYEHVFYPLDPTLAFIGILDKVVPWPVAEAQAAVLARIWMRGLPLPSESSMIDWLQASKGLGEESKGCVQIRYPDDTRYLNNLLRWARSMDMAKHPAVGAIGAVVPEEWNEAKIMMRVNTPAMKRSFQALGDARFTVRTTEELSMRSGLDIGLNIVSDQ
jgi:cation diffusion facilitator CzcD-associated flavoprotein CzcO